jgi:hypothetical protein
MAPAPVYLADLSVPVLGVVVRVLAAMRVHDIADDFLVPEARGQDGGDGGEVTVAGWAEGHLPFFPFIKAVLVNSC